MMAFHSQKLNRGFFHLILHMVPVRRVMVLERSISSVTNHARRATARGFARRRSMFFSGAVNKEKMSLKSQISPLNKRWNFSARFILPNREKKSLKSYFA